MKNTQEARTIARSRLDAWRRKPYAEIAKFLEEKGIEPGLATGESGFEYRLEIRVAWEEKEQGLISVTVVVENAGRFLFWVTICPSFRIFPDGTIED